MKITHCKLKKSIQKKLLEFFVLQVMARSAADLLGIQTSSAMLFYRKIRQVIAHHLELHTDEVFNGSVELYESYFWWPAKRETRPRCEGKVAVSGILKRNGKVY